MRTEDGGGGRERRVERTGGERGEERGKRPKNRRRHRERGDRKGGQHGRRGRSRGAERWKGEKDGRRGGRGVASSKTIIVFPIQFPSIAVPGASAPCWPIHRPDLRAALSGQPLPDPLALEHPRRPSAGRGSSLL